MTLKAVVKKAVQAVSSRPNKEPEVLTKPEPNLPKKENNLPKVENNLPEGVNVQDDFERIVFLHSLVTPITSLSDIKNVGINGFIVKEIDKPSTALRCKVCHNRAQFRLYDYHLFNNKLMCEVHTREALEAANVNTTSDTGNTNNTANSGQDAATVEVSKDNSTKG